MIPRLLLNSHQDKALTLSSVPKLILSHPYLHPLSTSIGTTGLR